MDFRTHRPQRTVLVNRTVDLRFRQLAVFRRELLHHRPNLHLLGGGNRRQRSARKCEPFLGEKNRPLHEVGEMTLKEIRNEQDSQR